MKKFDSNLYSSIILAAGLSSRMEVFKPMMLLGNKTFLEHVILLYKSVKINRILVVTGYQSQYVNYIANHYNIETVFNKQYKKGMFSSVLAGIEHLPKNTQYFFIHPVDIPLVKSSTIFQLIVRAEKEKKEILYPDFNNKRGHPPIININLKSAIMRWQYNGRLDLCLKTYNFLSANVPIADQTILMGANTLRNYDKLVLKFNKRNFLTPEECEVLMCQIIHAPNKIINHCKMVAIIASELAKAINNMSLTKLDIDLIYSSALVHDMAKGCLHHDKIGAKILKDMGYIKMGNIVGKHMSLRSNQTKPVDEAEIVYIADKLVCGQNFISLERRFREKLEYTKDLFIKRKIVLRMRNAYIIKDKIENITLITVERVLRKFENMNMNDEIYPQVNAK